MRLSPFACSLCGSRFWPDPDSSCELCQPHYDPETRRRYADPDWEAEDDTRRPLEEEQTENEK